jgi:hypothetical protein
MVYLKIQPYKHTSLSIHIYHELIIFSSNVNFFMKLGYEGLDVLAICAKGCPWRLSSLVAVEGGYMVEDQ